MEFVDGPPQRWSVTLTSGAVVELTADGYTETDDHAIFTVLVSVTSDEQLPVRITGHLPVKPPLSWLMVAKIPLSEIVGISSD
jgi:hypothetical protein